MNVSVANLYKVPEIRNKVLITLGLLFLGVFVFKRLRPQFADLV